MKLNCEKDEYIILELIPTGISPQTGQLVQLSALKLKGFSVVDRFDYRLDENNINFKKILDIISYDKNDFKYVDKEQDIWDSFINWSNSLPIMFIDNLYTKNFINHLENEKLSILDYLNMDYSDDVIDKLIDKYNLQPSNYIVDLLLESLIYDSNEK